MTECFPSEMPQYPSRANHEDGESAGRSRAQSRDPRLSYFRELSSLTVLKKLKLASKCWGPRVRPMKSVDASNCVEASCMSLVSGPHMNIRARSSLQCSCQPRGYGVFDLSGTRQAERAVTSARRIFARYRCMADSVLMKTQGTPHGRGWCREWILAMAREVGGDKQGRVAPTRYRNPWYYVELVECSAGRLCTMLEDATRR